MQQKLSPKKYIQTKARTLPVYKCFVNRDWQEGRMADVFVLRRHVNGHLTVGVYLVDLLCLGIKDSFYMFNEEEETVMEKIPNRLFKEIDYPLAHNIIFAGHDFALDFDIQPTADFSITKYILEEDTDAIPLMNIPPGDNDGKPHLMVDAPGQFSDALAKLKKHAGEGNYHYTVGHGFGEDGFEDDDPVEDEYASLDDYEIGTLTPLDAMYICMEDMIDEEKAKSRTPDEQLTLDLETLLRALRLAKPGSFGFDNITDLPEYHLYLGQDTPDELTGWDESKWPVKRDQDTGWPDQISDELFPLMKEAGRPLAKKLSELLSAFEGDLPAIGIIFHILITNENFEAHVDLVSSLRVYASQYPYARLMLAMAALRYPDMIPDDFSDIYDSTDIRDVFPEYDLFHIDELYVYWLIRMVQAIKNDNIQGATRFYALVAQTEILSTLLIYAQVELYQLIEPIVARSAFPEDD